MHKIVLFLKWSCVRYPKRLVKKALQVVGVEETGNQVTVAVCYPSNQRATESRMHLGGVVASGVVLFMGGRSEQPHELTISFTSYGDEC